MSHDRSLAIYLDSKMSAAPTDLNQFLDGIVAGWSFKYGGAVEAAGLEDIQMAGGFSEAELKDLVMENLQSVGALPFHVRLSLALF